MKKILIILILLTVTGGAFSPFFSDTEFFVKTAYAAPGDPCRTLDGSEGTEGFGGGCYSNRIMSEYGSLSGMLANAGSPFVWAFKEILGIIGSITLRLAALILALVGLLFDTILNYTIVEMAEHLSDRAGVGGAIDSAWTVLRDLANIVFIFILLWAAIQTILDIGGNLGKTIRNIIMVGLLINFSLFFSKVVIDASNIAAIGFYNSIIDSAGTPITVAGEEIGSFSSIIMRYTGVQSFFGDQSLDSVTSYGDDGGGFLLGILGTILILLVSIVFLVAGVLFLARFIILILLMILSPFALIGYALPALSGKTKEWWDALLNQSFFAPYFMILMWVAIRLMAVMPAAGDNVGVQFAAVASNPKGIMTILLNFALIIGLFVAALIFSKQMAMKTKGFGAIAGGLGTITVGGVALVGRRTVGAVASRAAKSQRFQRLAAQHQKTVGVLYSGTQKVAKGSFDVRGSTITQKATMGNIDVLGKAGGEGGFERYKEEKTKRIIDKGKSFTDRQARVEYGRRKASGILTQRGSLPNNVRSVFGILGSSNRIAAATLLDERIKELQTEMNQARGELNTLNNNMGFTPSVANPVPSPAQLGLLSPQERTRYTTLTSPAGTRDSIATMGAEQATLRADRTALGLENTLRQQF